ncbi:Beta-galactosidase [Streptomyces alboniger]
MHDDRTLIETRLAKALAERISPAVHPQSVPLEVEAWSAPGEPVPVAEGLAAPYQPVEAGQAWGRPWGTVWFRVRGTVPDQWAGRAVEAVMDLGFTGAVAGFQAEALVYRPDATAIKSLNPRTTWVRVADKAEGGEEVLMHLEASSNPEIDGPVSRMGDWDTSGDAPIYRLRRMDLAVFDTEVWELTQDFEVLQQLMLQLSTDDPRRWEILRTLERAVDLLDLDGDVNRAAPRARAVLADALARPAHASAHRISAIGHAHIDSAWLWPLRETVRKVARTTSNVTDLMDRDPGFVFAMSQAQQLAWIKERRPEVYARVREKVASGQFLPVGGMWVEADTNMPGSEAMARQFTHGKRFFLEEFGIETDEVWLPDSFGYSAAMPQLVRLSRSTYFLTQKISWSQFNKFPHHTFWWEGIDGTRVFTHFPPVDTYNASFTGEEMAHTVRNFQDKGSATRSLVPFGWGDGGGGPTREMLARARRLADLEGAPRVEIEKPSAFFAKARADYPNAPVWLGELYLELHRGTYTSVATTKRGNRRSEHLLREAELWSATATLRTGLAYPYERLDRLWKTVLLHQFHDILPGSSIAWVNREARTTYQDVMSELETVVGEALRALAGDTSAGGTVVFNAAPHGRDGVPALGGTPVTARSAEGSSPPPVDVRRRDLLVNGERVFIRGVNRHDFHPLTGRVLDEADLRADLTVIKRFGFNAVRTSHYPNDPALLDLADELGLYVVDEADIESHGHYDEIAHEPGYRAAFLERVARMASRDKNHPSVVIWSLGNESGYGPNHDAAAGWLRRYDPTRPLHTRARSAPNGRDREPPPTSSARCTRRSTRSSRTPPPASRPNR